MHRRWPFGVALLVFVLAPARSDAQACIARFASLIGRDTVAYEAVGHEGDTIRFWVDDVRQAARVRVRAITDAERQVPSLEVAVHAMARAGDSDAPDGASLQRAHVIVGGGHVVAHVTEGVSDAKQDQIAAVPAGTLPFMRGMVGFYLLLLARADHIGRETPTTVPVHWLFAGEDPEPATIDVRQSHRASIRMGTLLDAVVVRGTAGVVQSIVETHHSDGGPVTRTYVRLPCRVATPPPPHPGVLAPTPGRRD